MNVNQFASFFEGLVVKGKCYSPEEGYGMARHQYDELNDDIAVYSSYMYKREISIIGLLL